MAISMKHLRDTLTPGLIKAVETHPWDNSWAVYADYSYADQQWLITKVEPWDFSTHTIVQEDHTRRVPRGVYRIRHAEDELDAYKQFLEQDDN